MSANHSPAPWTVGDMAVEVFDANGKHVVWEMGASEADGASEQRTANAHLIAAAPDYYDATQAMIERHDAKARLANFDACGCDDCKPFRPIQAKAEGRS